MLLLYLSFFAVFHHLHISGVLYNSNLHFTTSIKQEMPNPSRMLHYDRVARRTIYYSSVEVTSHWPQWCRHAHLSDHTHPPDHAHPSDNVAINEFQITHSYYIFNFTSTSLPTTAPSPAPPPTPPTSSLPPSFHWASYSEVIIANDNMFLAFYF